MKTSLRKHACVLLSLTLLLTLAACGGGSTSTTSSGTVYVGGTDAPGDFVDYTVTIQSLTLTRRDGTVVNLLPTAATLNLAEDDALTDLLNAATVPAGTYTSMVATLDYSQATIEAVSSSGQPVALEPVNSQGQALGTVSVPIEFGNNADLVVQPGEPRFLTLDFSLDASNTVNLTSNPPTVVVAPFLDASIGVTSQPVRLRGPLDAVDLASETYTVGIRPFFTGPDGGRVTIATAPTTVYDVNGTTYEGNAGLVALSGLPPLAAVSSRVTMDASTGTLTATAVYAGSSVPGGTLDAVRGTVTAISGSSLTVLGAVLVRSTGTVTYNTLFTVTTGPGTIVHQDGTMGTLALNTISVGQRITALGTVSGTAPSSLVLDTDPGEIRLGFSVLRGTVVTTGSGDLTLDLLSIDHRPVSLFNFAGTGSSSALDANPSDYVAATGALGLAGLAGNDPVRVAGFVTPYGSAPPDFNAVSVADYANARAVVFLSWFPGETNAAFTALNDGEIVPNLSSNPTIDVLKRGDVRVALTSLASAPMIEPAATGAYLIRQNGTLTLHRTFAGFVSDLGMRLNGGAEVKSFWAQGGFNNTQDTLTALRIAVRLS